MLEEMDRGFDYYITKKSDTERESAVSMQKLFTCKKVNYTLNSFEYKF